MPISNIKTSLPHNIKKVWDIVTSLENYSWRSDLSKIKVLDKCNFIEYAKNGYATKFKITSMELYHRWEFDMENDNMNGHWTGLFFRDGDHTIIDFTENIIAKKILMKPFVGMYLKKQQATYVSDLQKALKQ